jgi:hypothetical protein
MTRELGENKSVGAKHASFSFYTYTAWIVFYKSHNHKIVPEGS